ncbi:ribosomal protection-like ABC-F family protein [Vagococcus silagei]|uniref:ABC-F family ATP-binding cassette domain-containing protein n=1 Tax=Vagococcus silagei TaxID=2508885 RepID=A0A4V3TV53_9ENTE|nr:ABC-F family ATP-binding cassette domain-containing protein [Vagococcus silagei]THB61589.1 ABC-F family ATP-binding cassette domain-containing protein [Vagococcus silagei]
MLQINNGYKTVYGTVLFEDLNLEVKTGEKVALIGGNGAGKTTLLRVLTGEEKLEKGELSISKNETVSLLEQASVIDTNQTAYEFICSGKKDLFDLEKKLKRLEHELTQVSEKELTKKLTYYGRLQDEFIELGGYTLQEEVSSIATGLGISQLLSEKIANLSGGQQTLVKLTKILIEKGDIILLDEPTNHLDQAGLKWLENYLSYVPQTVIIVSHDRYFLDRVVQRVVLIDELKAQSYPGNYTKFLELRKLEFAQKEKDFLLYQKEQRKIDDAIRRFRHWGAIADNEKMFKKAKQLEKKKEKMTEVKRPHQELLHDSQTFKETNRSGKDVLKIQALWKSFDELTLFEEATANVYVKDRIAILGNNGSGKSTLIKMILGTESIDAGEIKLGSNIKLGYLPQIITFDKGDDTILSYFKRECQLDEETSRRLLSYYLFKQDDVFKNVTSLSGGEKVRLKLAVLLQQDINLLILDEPTNHLDIETREWLENLLMQFDGSLLMISHDRYFVTKLASKYWKIKDYQLCESLTFGEQ